MIRTGHAQSRKTKDISLDVARYPLLFDEFDSGPKAPAQSLARPLPERSWESLR